ncbi:hypothetical protein B0H14DRAFT_3860471 [Mycena olivaceomarginata]|nr:hypothetical protein B0H14DRAFT_3860471 [Mycena olivaceomarginata]
MAASPSSSTSSLYTTTSSSTQWGPGALAGKALLGLGKAVVRGAEHVIILRRLSAIKAAMPCSDPIDSAQSQGFEKMFGDVLELSRKGLYPEAIRIQAMHTIVVQIARRHTHYLRLSLSKLKMEHDEIVALLCEIVAVVLFPNRGLPSLELVAAYRSALPKNVHPWSPCICFMQQVAQLTEGTFRAALDARFIDVILWAFGAQLQTLLPDSELQADCNRALAVLSRPPSHDLLVLWVEEIRKYYLDDEPLVSVMQIADAISARDLWSAVERRLLEVQGYRMLHSAFVFLTPQKNMAHPMEPYGVPLQPAISFFFPSQSARSAIALQNLIRCIALGGQVHNETEQYLSSLSYGKLVLVVTNLIRPLVDDSLAVRIYAHRGNSPAG